MSIRYERPVGVIRLYVYAVVQQMHVIGSVNARVFRRGEMDDVAIRFDFVDGEIHAPNRSIIVAYRLYSSSADGLINSIRHHFAETEQLFVHRLRAHNLDGLLAGYDGQQMAVEG